MIIANKVCKKFQKGNKKNDIFYAVNGISFEAHDGEVLGILGPNGAGKTTLLRIVAGIMEASSGSITYDTYDIKKDTIAIKGQLAYLSGNTRIYESLTPYELLNMCCDFYNMSKNERKDRIDEIAKLLKMESFLNRRIGKLSTGQTQKVNIARSFVHNPKYYILDEVTSGLDIISSQIILDFIKEEKKKGKSILYSTHYMEEAENICDRVIMVNKGNVIADGTPEEIKKETNTTNLRDAFFALIGGVYEE